MCAFRSRSSAGALRLGVGLQSQGALWTIVLPGLARLLHVTEREPVGPKIEEDVRVGLADFEETTGRVQELRRVLQAADHMPFPEIPGRRAELVLDLRVPSPELPKVSEDGG